MPRIAPLPPETADARTDATLKAVRAKLGMLPNLFTTAALFAGSIRLLERLGFQREGTKRKAHRDEDGLHDVVALGLLPVDQANAMHSIPPSLIRQSATYREKLARSGDRSER